jgi:hypothetical protein
MYRQDMTSNDVDRLAIWANSFPERSQERWREARAAYHWFLDPEIDDKSEVLRRWEIVVHLVHNFKSHVLLGPIRDWGVLPDSQASPWPTMWVNHARPQDQFRSDIVTAVLDGRYAEPP